MIKENSDDLEREGREFAHSCVKDPKLITYFQEISNNIQWKLENQTNTIHFDIQCVQNCQVHD